MRVVKDVSIRPAVKADSLKIAEFYRISSDGVADYVWKTLAEPGEDILQVGQCRYERENTAYSYQNCIVAELKQNVVGMLAAYPMSVDGSEEDDPVLRPYHILEEDQSYYIAGVAVSQEYRGLGVGSMLMQRAETNCSIKQLRKLSLIVFEQNTAALRLYERLG